MDVIYTKVDLIAQVFDGAQNQVSYIGGELSNYKHLTVGLDYGLTDYLSVGGNIKYLFNPPEIPNKEDIKNDAELVELISDYKDQSINELKRLLSDNKIKEAWLVLLNVV